MIGQKILPYYLFTWAWFVVFVKGYVGFSLNFFSN